MDQDRPSLRGFLFPAAMGFCLFFSLFFSLGHRPLVDPDEGRYASIPSAMVRSGDWVVPLLNGLPYLEKPPALYWSVAASLELFGESEFAVRLAPALQTALLALLVLGLGWRLGGRRTGSYAVLVFLSIPAVLILGRLPLTDLPLSLGVAVSLGTWSMVLAGESRPAVDILFWSGIAIAFLSKGPVGLPLVFLPLLVTARSAGWPLVRRIFRLRGAALFLVLVVPWFWAVSRRVPGALDFFFWHEHVDRFLGTGTRRPHGLGPLDFLAASFGVTLPWVLLALRPTPPGGGGSPIERRERLLLLSWFLCPAVLFLASSSRLITYLYPGLPALALLAGREISRREGRPAPRSIVRWMGGLAIAFGAASFIIPALPLLPLRIPGLETAGALLWLVPLLGACFVASGFVLFRSGGWGSLCLAASLCLAGGWGNFLSDEFGPLRTTRDVVRAALEDRERPVVVNIEEQRQSLEFYLGHPVFQYRATGELEFGQAFDTGRPRILMQDEEEIGKLLDDRGTIYLVCDERWSRVMAKVLHQPLEWVAGSDRNQLFRVKAR